MVEASDQALVATRASIRGVETVSTWKLKIAASWKTAAASILSVAKDLVDAQTALTSIDRKQWEQLKSELHNEKIISEAIQKKLIYIGQHYAKLSRHTDHLPPRYNAIYQLSHLKEQQLSKLVEDKKLTPTLEDREVAKLLTSKKSSSKNDRVTSAEAQIPLLRVVQIKKRLSPDAKALLLRSIKSLGNVDGIELRFTEDGERYSLQVGE